MAGVGIRFRWTGGNPQFARQMLRRAEYPDRAIEDWRRTDVPRRIIGMFQAGGRVGGQHGQGPWKPNSPWTRAQKGHGQVLIGGFGSAMFQFGRMVRSYRIVAKRRGVWWTFTISNDARGENGFDYPSLHHTGGNFAKGQRFTVRPRRGGEFLSWRDANGTRHFYRETHPSRVPARPHLQFYGLDVRNLQRRFLRYVLGNQRGGRMEA